MDPTSYSWYFPARFLVVFFKQAQNASCSYQVFFPPSIQLSTSDAVISMDNIHFNCARHPMQPSLFWIIWIFKCSGKAASENICLFWMEIIYLKIGMVKLFHRMGVCARPTRAFWASEAMFWPRFFDLYIFFCEIRWHLRMFTFYKILNGAKKHCVVGSEGFFWACLHILCPLRNAITPPKTMSLKSISWTLTLKQGMCGVGSSIDFPKPKIQGLNYYDWGFW